MRRLSKGLRATVGVCVGAVVLAVPPGVSVAGQPGPALTEPRAALDGALTCIGPPLKGSSRDPVLLFPAFSTDRESYGSNYLADLPSRGIPTCSITLDDFGFHDLQRAAEYAVYAIRTVSERSGRDVAVIGHQHGAINWLQALRYWPDIAGRVSDYISLATPHRGTDSARSYCDQNGSCAPAVWQIATGSQLLTKLTEVQAPPGPSYTSIATEYDVLITPAPEASQMAGARNIVLQDICPGRPVDHFTILTDDLARRLSFDALDNPGPADPARLSDPCNGSAGPGGSSDEAAGFPGRFARLFVSEAVPAEPELRCYVAGTCPADTRARCSTPTKPRRTRVRRGVRRVIKVRLTHGDKPVRGAVVRLRGPGFKQRARTGARGRVRFRVRASRNGHARATTRFCGGKLRLLKHSVAPRPARPAGA